MKRNFAAFQSDVKGVKPSSSVTKKNRAVESNIKVYTRIRPISSENYTDTYQINPIENSILINKPEDIIAKNGGIKKFFFTEVFDPDNTQEDVMKQTCVPLVDDLINSNKSSLLFTYGVTNAGKTHTIIGSKENPGILPRTIHLLLSTREEILKDLQNYTHPLLNIDGQFDVKISQISQVINHPEYRLSDLQLALESYEIYNEEVYDLLCDLKKDKGNGSIARQKLQMKEREDNRILIKGCTSVELSSHEQVDGLLDRCIANRSLADTMLNSTSSRSHSLFKITSKLIYKTSANQCVMESSLCIVDLAGSERAKRTENSGNQLLEACNINKSLLVLGRCLKSLKDSQAPGGSNLVVPYRDSKLTRILYEYFHEENNLRMIANINPRQIDFEETMRVLNYAAIAKDIQPIKSKIDNVRKSLFSLNSTKDSLKTDERLSLTSNEDTIFQLHKELEEKEPKLANPKNYKEQSLFEGSVNEKDLKIKILEEMVTKLHEQLYLKDITNRLSSVNEGSHPTLKLPNGKDSVVKMVDHLISTSETSNYYNKENTYINNTSVMQPEITPCNVNYFIFQGPVHEKNLQGLQKLLNIKLPKNHIENRIILGENPSNKTTPDSHDFGLSIEMDSLHSSEEKFFAKKKRSNKPGKKLPSKKEKAYAQLEEVCEIPKSTKFKQFMGDYEDLSTPELLKIITENEGIYIEDIPPFEVKEEEGGRTPVAKRTRNAKRK